MADNLKYVRARAKQWQLGTANTGNEQVEVMFVVTDEQHELYGRHFTWYAHASPTSIAAQQEGHSNG